MFTPQIVLALVNSTRKIPAIYHLIRGISALNSATYVLGGYTDFRQLYCGAYMMRVGLRHELYDLSLQETIENRVVSPSPVVLPANHPSFEYLLLTPLAFFQYRLAYGVWMIVNLAALALCVILLPIRDRWLKGSLIVGFSPISLAVVHGQDSILLLLLLLLASRTEDEFMAGLILGCGAFRFHVLLPIFLVYCFWRKWKFLSGAAIASGGLALISVSLCGIGESIEYVRMAAKSTDVAASTRTTFLAFLKAIFKTHDLWIAAIWVLTAVGVLVLLSKKKPSLATAVLAVPFLSYHLQPYDLTILLLPIAFSLSTAGVAQFVAATLSLFPMLTFVSSIPSLAMITESQRSRLLWLQQLRPDPSP